MKILLMVFLMGGLGGCIRMLSSLVKYIGNGLLTRNWLPFYYLGALTGAIIAPVVYLMFRAGALAASSNQSAADALNLVSIYGFAGLTGLFSKNATDKLEEVFKTIFPIRQPDKDSLMDRTKTEPKPKNPESDRSPPAVTTGQAGESEPPESGAAK